MVPLFFFKEQMQFEKWEQGLALFPNATWISVKRIGIVSPSGFLLQPSLYQLSNDSSVISHDMVLIGDTVSSEDVSGDSGDIKGLDYIWKVNN